MTWTRYRQREFGCQKMMAKLRFGPFLILPHRSMPPRVFPQGDRYVVVCTDKRAALGGPQCGALARGPPVRLARAYLRNTDRKPEKEIESWMEDEAEEAAGEHSTRKPVGTNTSVGTTGVMIIFSREIKATRDRTIGAARPRRGWPRVGIPYGPSLVPDVDVR